MPIYLFLFLFAFFVSQNEKTQNIMKYALLVYQSQEAIDNRDNAASVAAGKAYGEALQAAGDSASWLLAIFPGCLHLTFPYET